MADLTNIDKTAEAVKSLYTNGSSIVSKIAGVFRGNKPKLDKPTAETTKPQAAKVTFNGLDDFRPRLQIPSSYLDNYYTRGPYGNIKSAKGIIFPYTPTITQDYKATYSSVAPMHSNYAIYSYKNSAPGEISLSAKFTVQSDDDAWYYLSVVHLLRSLTKMKFGKDEDKGAPPPVCRLFAYGDFVLNNVPVVLQSFQLKLDDTCDYYTFTNATVNIFGGNNTVPTMSTFTLSFIPMYSRAEMLEFNVGDWLDGDLRKKGYL